MKLEFGKKGQKKELEFGDEIRIETDGENVTISDGRIEFCENGSPLEVLYIISWFMRAAKKTTLVMKDNETEYVRKKEYWLGELKLHGKHKDKDKTDQNS